MFVCYRNGIRRSVKTNLDWKYYAFLWYYRFVIPSLNGIPSSGLDEIAAINRNSLCHLYILYMVCILSTKFEINFCKNVASAYMMTLFICINYL